MIIEPDRFRDYLKREETETIFGEIIEAVETGKPQNNNIQRNLRSHNYTNHVPDHQILSIDSAYDKISVIERIDLDKYPYH